jgi:uncharacterized protein YdiU (UPF0061 family)
MTNKKPTQKVDVSKSVAYGYYSKLLQKPFDSVEELLAAEAEHFAQLKAKEDKAATKKADAQKVEEAFKAMNAARKDYKESMVKLTNLYQESMKKLKDAFEIDKNEAHDALVTAEKNYETCLKEFTAKYPEGYHLTLKDGDFETTINSRSSYTTTADECAKVSDIIDWLFRGI